MVDVKVENQVPMQLRRYSAIAGKTIRQGIWEEARLLAQRLMALCPPKNAKQGKNAVENDINKIYLQDSWFTEKFKFRNEKFGDKTKELILAKDEAGLTAHFQPSKKLSKLHIEPFKEAIIKKFRKKGKVSENVHPSSFPVADQISRQAYQKKKQGMVGWLKSGWANCVVALGGKVASWLKKPGTGFIINNLNDKTNPRITIVNDVRFAKQVDDEKQISSRALLGRQRDLERKIDSTLKHLKSGKWINI